MLPWACQLWQCEHCLNCYVMYLCFRFVLVQCVYLDVYGSSNQSLLNIHVCNGWWFILSIKLNRKKAKFYHNNNILVLLRKVLSQYDYRHTHTVYIYIYMYFISIMYMVCQILCLSFANLPRLRSDYNGSLTVTV